MSNLDTQIEKGAKKDKVNKDKKFTVRICEEYLFREPDKVNAILDRVSKIISNSYISKDAKSKT